MYKERARGMNMAFRLKRKGEKIPMIGRLALAWIEQNQNQGGFPLEWMKFVPDDLKKICRRDCFFINLSLYI